MVDGTYFKVAVASGLSPGSAVTSPVSLGKLFNPSEPQFLLLQEDYNHVCLSCQVGQRESDL